MRALPLLMLLVTACAHTALRTEDVNYSSRDYLATALETLTASDPDVHGLRVQAQLETKAALEQLVDGATSHRVVPYDGPPRLEVALELLERSEGALTKTGDAEALEHTRRAAQSLRLALAPR
ncbi:MAG: hypothetical protein GQE15_22480 [Archangiaceae bacterium]|nr:hypothetical protein [Archangiaceae bacterium]